MGYDNFFDPTVMKLPEKGWGVPDGEVMHYVERHLEKEGKKPFYVSIITMTSHEPFNNFKHFVSDGRFDDVVPALTGRYFASLAYTDRAVKEFVESMQKKYPDTYFFLYGDHTPYVINEGAFRRSVLRDEDEKEMVLEGSWRGPSPPVVTGINHRSGKLWCGSGHGSLHLCDAFDPGPGHPESLGRRTVSISHGQQTSGGAAGNNRAALLPDCAGPSEGGFPHL